MSDSDSDIEVSNLISKLTGPLFGLRKQKGASLNDVTVGDGSFNNDPLYAVTVNIQPTKLINKRQWKLYNHDKQRSFLTRIEAKLRQQNPSIELIEIHYETCPTLNNIHFHALYRMPKIFISTMQNYYKTFSSTDNKTKEPWRHILVEDVYDKEGWLAYIRKMEKTQ